jgi:hypothetical protein
MASDNQCFHSSLLANQTLVSRVTGRDTHHYNNEEDSIWLLEHTTEKQFNPQIYMMIKCSIVIFLRNLFIAKSSTGGISVGVSHFQKVQIKNLDSQNTN